MTVYDEMFAKINVDFFCVFLKISVKFTSQVTENFNLVRN